MRNTEEETKVVRTCTNGRYAVALTCVGESAINHDVGRTLGTAVSGGNIDPLPHGTHPESKYLSF